MTKVASILDLNKNWKSLLTVVMLLTMTDLVLVGADVGIGIALTREIETGAAAHEVVVVVGIPPIGAHE